MAFYTQVCIPNPSEPIFLTIPPVRQTAFHDGWTIRISNTSRHQTFMNKPQSPLKQGSHCGSLPYSILDFTRLTSSPPTLPLLSSQASSSRLTSQPVLLTLCWYGPLASVGPSASLGSALLASSSTSMNPTTAFASRTARTK